MGIYYGCNCDSKSDFEPLYFKLENYEFKASPEQYIVETWNSRKRFCYFLMQGSNMMKNKILLGDSFLRNYYVYHDVTNQKMGLYGNHMIYTAPVPFTIELIYIVFAVGAVLVLLSV